MKLNITKALLSRGSKPSESGRYLKRQVTRVFVHHRGMYKMEWQQRKKSDYLQVKGVTYKDFEGWLGVDQQNKGMDTRGTPGKEGVWAKTLKQKMTVHC